jgi:hypothetical protein
MEKTFEEWFDAFMEFVNAMGYSSFIDKDAIKEFYEEGVEPLIAANTFVLEMRS